ncbi:MAG: arsenite methyltransferase [Phycisphaerales bacterium JB065]
MNDKTKAPCCGPDCCSPSSESKPTLDANAVRDQVRAGYGAIATGGGWSAMQESVSSGDAAASSCCSPAGGCCGPATFSPDELAKAIGYADDDLAGSVEEANLGLSCGNPTAIAALKPGEVVIDLGSGGGFDCFIAGPKVGASGRVIGIDMTPDMLSLARKNTAMYRDRTGLDNVEFRLGEIENLPVADASVDVVISNCVLNLSPDKPRVWAEIARVLKPGGRVAVSDLALRRELPEAVKADVEALVGCVAGAVLIDEIRDTLVSLDFDRITLTEKPEYIDAMSGFQDPLYAKIAASLPEGTRMSDFVTSLDIAAIKPAGN